MSRSSKSLCSGLDGQKLIELRNRVPDFVDSGHELDEKIRKGISESDISVLVKKRLSEPQDGKKKGKKGKNGEADRGTCGEDKAMETIIGRKSLRSHNADKEAKTQEPIESSKRESCSKKKKYEGERDNANGSDLVLLEKRHSLRSKSQLSSISESVGTSDSPVMETTIVAQEEQDPGTPVIDTGNQENALSDGEKQLSDFAPDQEIEPTSDDWTSQLDKVLLNLTPIINSEKMLQPMTDAAQGNPGVKSLSYLGDSTARFFESMAMTVATFPQHIQASIKARVCKLVVEMEYGLSLPPAL